MPQMLHTHFNTSASTLEMPNVLQALMLRYMYGGKVKKGKASVWYIV